VAAALAVIVGSGVVGGGAGAPSDSAPARSALAVDYVPRPSPWAVPSATPDPASFEGASVLAAGGLAIPPRWLASRAQSHVTVRLGGLGWRTHPNAE
jgi:hypothetical protein